MRLIITKVSCGKSWQLVCTGNSCPCPGSVTQNSHLQPTCQRAAANMVADNWWGRGGWSRGLGLNLLKSICKSWINKTVINTLVHHHVCTTPATIYISSMYTTIYGRSLYIDTLTAKISYPEITYSWPDGGASFLYISLHHLLPFNITHVR